MATKTRPSNGTQKTTAKGLNVALINKDFSGYGGAGAPKYDLVEDYGTCQIVNTVKTRFTDFYDMRDNLEEEQGGIIYSKEFDVHTLGINTGDNIIQFAGFVHNDKGPVVDTEMHIIKVVANDDIEYDGEVVVTKGRMLLKAVTTEYLNKLKKAA